MKKNDHNKESLSYNKEADLNLVIGRIPDPIPSWLEPFIKPYHAIFPADINDGIIEGYPVDDDF